MLKRILYFILLIAELFVGSLLMSSLWMSALYIPVAVAAALLLAIVIWQIISYNKATDPALKKKALRNIALAMLIPSAIFFITYVVVAVAFIIAFV